jgi:hypothetical protein
MEEPPRAAITEYFAELTDPRMERTKRHLLLDILVIALCAVICGAEGWVDLEAYGKAKEAWLRQFLLLPHGIPSHATFCNYTVCAESVVEWITECIRYVREKGFRRIAPTPQAEAAWVEHINKAAAGSIFTQAKSAWFMGTNIPEKARAILLTPIPAPAYWTKCAEAAAKGYEGFVLQ